MHNLLISILKLFSLSWTDAIRTQPGTILVWNIRRMRLAAATELAASTIKDTLLMSRNFSELSDSWSLITAPSSGSSASGASTELLQQQNSVIIEEGAPGTGQSAVSSTSASDSSSTFSSSTNHGTSYGSTTGSSSGSSAGASSVSGGETEEIKTIVTCRAVYPQVRNDN